jgi:hypothetical protein
MFRGMFKLPSPSPASEAAPIPVDDSSSVLEIALPYVYGVPIGPFELNFPETWDVFKVFDKYEARTSVLVCGAHRRV